MNTPPKNKTHEERKKKLEADAESYEQTIVLPRKEPAGRPEIDVESYEQTIVLPRKEPAGRPEIDIESYEQTIVLPRKKLERGSEADAESYEATVISSREELERKPAADSETFTITELEREYYQNSVKKGRHGREKYRLEGILGTGGMGAIFNVLDQDFHRPLAMKVLLPALKNDLESLNSFVTEAKITGFLEHPNIISIHELGLLREAGIFFTMKLVQGETLKDILREIKRNNPKYVEKYNTYLLLSIFRKVCDAVSFAHFNNLLHLDIKPHNIIIGRYGEVFLMDWGVTKILSDPEKESDPVKREFLKDLAESLKKKDHQIKGSPAFMSPEQANGEFHLLDKPSDIFLLGATLYHIFTLDPPYVGNDIPEVLNKAKTRDLILPEIRNPGRQIPEEICRIIMKSMAPNKEERYQSVEELSQDIDDLIAGKWLQQEIKVFSSGEMLMREGETGEEAYLILSGSVVVTTETNGNKVILRTGEAGDIIGEMALISEEPRCASVQALEKTEVAVLTKHVLSQNLKKLPPYMEKIVSTLTHRLQEATSLIHPHLTCDCTYVVLKQLRLIFREKSDTQSQNFAIPFREIVEEISEDLGLPNQKVRDVLLKTEELNLIVCENDNVQIPDMDELTLYTKSFLKIRRCFI